MPKLSQRAKARNKRLKLIKANRAKWVKALRSGAFKQTHGHLKETVNGQAKYCCLGVARCVLKGLGRDDELLSTSSALRCLGLKTHLLGDAAPGTQNELASLNDDGKTFKAIAKVIESMPIAE